MQPGRFHSWVWVLVFSIFFSRIFAAPASYRENLIRTLALNSPEGTMRSIDGLSDTPPWSGSDVLLWVPAQDSPLLPTSADPQRTSNGLEKFRLPMVTDAFGSIAVLGTTTSTASSPDSTTLTAFPTSLSSYPTKTGAFAMGPGLALLPTRSAQATDTKISDTSHIQIQSLVIIGCVLGAIIGLSLHLILVTRCCRREKGGISTEGIFACFPLSTWSKANLLRSSPVKEKGTTRRNHPDERVIEITKDFPRSKFSVTSSDYPISFRSSLSVNGLGTAISYSPDEARNGEPCQSSDQAIVAVSNPPGPLSSGLWSVRHSRTQSTPVSTHRPKSVQSVAESTWDVARAYGRFGKAQSAGGVSFCWEPGNLLKAYENQV